MRLFFVIIGNKLYYKIIGIQYSTLNNIFNLSNISVFIMQNIIGISNAICIFSQWRYRDHLRVFYNSVSLVPRQEAFWKVSHIYFQLLSSHPFLLLTSMLCLYCSQKSTNILSSVIHNKLWKRFFHWILFPFLPLSLSLSLSVIFYCRHPDTSAFLRNRSEVVVRNLKVIGVLLLAFFSHWHRDFLSRRRREGFHEASQVSQFYLLYSMYFCHNFCHTITVFLLRKSHCMLFILWHDRMKKTGVVMQMIVL